MPDPRPPICKIAKASAIGATAPPADEISWAPKNTRQGPEASGAAISTKHLRGRRTGHHTGDSIDCPADGTARPWPYGLLGRQRTAG
jgi:hypothetical protein